MDRSLARFLRMIALATIIAFVFGRAIWYFAAEHSLARLYTVLFWWGAGGISVAALLFAGATDEYIAPRLSEGFAAARNGGGVPYASDLRYASARASGVGTADDRRHLAIATVSVMATGAAEQGFRMSFGGSRTNTNMGSRSERTRGVEMTRSPPRRSAPARLPPPTDHASAESARITFAKENVND